MTGVSVCIPAYENPGGVIRLMTSVAEQDYRNMEVIVSDDSKTDSVLDALRGFVQDHPEFVMRTFVPQGAQNRGTDGSADAAAKGAAGNTAGNAEAGGGIPVLYIRHASDGRAASNWNEAVSHARGKYVKLMHHDDWFSSADALASLAALLEGQPECALAFCGTYQVALAAGSQDAAAAAPYSYSRCISPEDAQMLCEDWRSLYLGNTIGAPSAVLVRRDVLLQENITYDENLTWLVDGDYYMQILSRHPAFAFTRKPLVSIGLSQDQLTGKVGEDQDILRREYIYVYRKFSLGGAAPQCREKLAEVLAGTRMPYRDIPEDLHITRGLYRDAMGRKKREQAGRYLDTAAYLLRKYLDPLKEKLDRPSAIAFYAGLLIEVGVELVTKSALYNPWEGQIFRLTFLLFFFRMLCSRFDRRQNLWLVMALGLGFVSWRISGRNELLRCTAFIAALAGMKDIRRAMKCVFWTTMGGCLVLAVLSMTGIFGVLSLTQDFGGGVETRYCLGLGHPNALHCMAAMLMIFAMYLYAGKWKMWQFAMILAANAGLYLLTKSNTAFAVAAMAAVLYAAAAAGTSAAEGRWKAALQGVIRNDAWWRAGELIFGAGLAFSFICAVVNPWHSPLLWKMDDLLTGRISALWDSTFHEGTLSTWSWFSSPANEYFFDMGWVRLVYWYGVIPAAVVIALIFLLMEAMRKRRDTAGFVMLFTCCVYTIMEAHLISEYIGRNYILMIAALYLASPAAKLRHEA